MGLSDSHGVRVGGDLTQKLREYQTGFGANGPKTFLFPDFALAPKWGGGKVRK